MTAARRTSSGGVSQRVLASGALAARRRLRMREQVEQDRPADARKQRRHRVVAVVPYQAPLQQGGEVAAPQMDDLVIIAVSLQLGDEAALQFFDFRMHVRHGAMSLATSRV